MNLKRKASGIWAVHFMDNGTLRRVTTGSRDKKIAMQRAREIVYGDPNAAQAPIPTDRKADAGGVTMKELFEKCRDTVWREGEVRSQATIRSQIKILTPLIGHELASDITYSRLEALQKAMLGMGYAPATVKRKMDMVSKALKMATIWTDENNKPLLKAKPTMPTITVRNKRERIVGEEDERAIFEAVAARAIEFPSMDWTRYGFFLRFLLDTGCRLAEALNVHVSHLETRTVEVRGQMVEKTFLTIPRTITKNGKPRVLPLSQAIEDTLPYLRMAAVEGRLFPWNNATAWYRWKVIRDDVKAEEGIDLDDLVLHSFRHTCLTRLAKREKIHKVSYWAGHSSIQITADRYGHLSPDDMLDLVGVLDGI
jgi:integrase